MLSLAFLPIKAANLVIVGISGCAAFQLSKIQHQKSWTLLSGLCLGGGSDVVAGLCTQNGGQYCEYGLVLAHSPVVVHDG
jgi:hypothetical protein